MIGSQRAMIAALAVSMGMRLVPEDYDGDAIVISPDVRPERLIPPPPEDLQTKRSRRTSSPGERVVAKTGNRERERRLRQEVRRAKKHVSPDALFPE